MLATAINYGRPQYFPTCVGNIWLERGIEHPLDLDNPLAAKELAAFPMVDVTIIKSDKKETAKLKSKYEKYTINQLRRMAAQKNMKGTHTAKKAYIIKKLLEEKNGL